MALTSKQDITKEHKNTKTGNTWASDNGDWLTEVAPTNGSAGGLEVSRVFRKPQHALVGLNAQMLKRVGGFGLSAGTHGNKDIKLLKDRERRD